ncbi:MAG: hypothetical protein K9L68_09220 [Spirochaetales bacterium]|nr:hypothetical protein [Spirochaetales bacterium]MCF7938765.1 hypothetical protein [Spirochaetales bacterium]
MIPSVIEILALAAAGLVLVLLISLSRLKGNRAAGRPDSAGNSTVLHTKQPKTCPLCGSELETGERVRSVIYPGTPDRIMHIFGCPHCYPARPDPKRTCPVCKVTMPEEGHLVARVFENERRTHVHVLGCTRCRRHA